MRRNLLAMLVALCTVTAAGALGAPAAAVPMDTLACPSVPATHDPAVTVIVYRVARSYNVNDKVMLSTFEAGWVESHMNNLPCGYFRDLQIIKEVFIPAFGELYDCLDMATYIIERMKVNEHILEDERYNAMFSVEEVNRRVYAGTPFRDAYKQVGLDIEAGRFTPDKNIRHTHEGSIGNLCNAEIAQHMDAILREFHFEQTQEAVDHLLGK